MKYSTGSWKVISNIAAPTINLDSCTMVDCNQAPICIVTNNWIPDGQNEANAKLISAAPDLLEALQAILPFTKEWINENHPDMKKALAAIKKATE